MYHCALLVLLRVASAHMPPAPELQSYDRTRLDYEPRSASGRRLTGAPHAGWEPMRIHVDTSRLQNGFQNQAILSYVENDLLPAAIRWISGALRIRPVQGRLQLEQHCTSYYHLSGKCAAVDVSCGSTVVIPKAHLRDREVCQTNSFGTLSCTTSAGGLGVASADFILYVTAAQCPQGVAGYANTCRQDTQDRPIAGYLNLCKISQDWDTDLSLVVHEVFHALGFSSSMFPFFRYDDGSPRTPRNSAGMPPLVNGKYAADDKTVKQVTLPDGTSKHYIVLPRAVAAAKNHFGCVGLDKVPLEEAGGDGSAFSHWEERTFYGEVMAARLSSLPVLSPMTLALFEDSGWYKPVLSKSGEFTFGRNKGCSFVIDQCVTNGQTNFQDTFCTNVAAATSCSWNQFAGSTLRCSHDHRAKVGCAACVHSSPLPAKFQYFANPNIGGSGSFMGFCPLFTAYRTASGTSFCRDPDSSQNAQQTGESFGAASMCVTSTIISKHFMPNAASASCRQIECQSSGLRIRVGQEWVFCSSTDAGKHVSASADWNGHVVCPSYTAVCSGPPSHYGIPCLFPSAVHNGHCVCAPGYINSDCSVRDTAVNRGQYPYGLQYNMTEIVLDVGGTIPSQFRSAPTLLGRTVGITFTSSPPLPTGLVLTADGAVSGSPQGAVQRTTHVIRAALANGASSTTAVFVTINCPAGNLNCPVSPSSSTTSVTPGTPASQNPTTSASTSSLPVQMSTPSQKPVSASTQQSTGNGKASSDSIILYAIIGAVACVLVALLVMFICYRYFGKSKDVPRTDSKRLRSEAHRSSRSFDNAVTVSAQGRDVGQHAGTPRGPRAGPRAAAHTSRTSTSMSVSESDRNEAMHQLLEMGYAFDATLAALERSNWNLAQATEILLAESQDVDLEPAHV